MPNVKMSRWKLIVKISETCGMSTSSVYQILNCKASFTPEKRAAVTELAEKFGYYNINSANGSGASGINIAVIIPRKPSVYWTKMLDGMNNAVDMYNSRTADKALKARLIVFSFLTGLDEEDLVRAVNLAVSSAPDVLIVTPSCFDNAENIFADISSSVKMIFVDNKMRRFNGAVYIGTDHYRDSEDAAEMIYLSEHRKKNIALITCLARNSEYYTERKIRGFREKMNLLCPDSDIRTFMFSNDKLISSMLARTLYDEYHIKKLDFAYVLQGMQPAVSLALKKLRRISGSGTEETLCVCQEYYGRENPGHLYGYVNQDVKLIGQTCAEQAIAYMTGTPYTVRDIIIPSKATVLNCL